MRREFLQLANKYDPRRCRVAGWFISEKLDGTRCLWDGGVSRGVSTEQVPWAGVLNPRTGQPKDKVKPIATGLWSRYGNPIIAPDWFLDLLPSFPLDGELWAGRGNFQLCRSICAGDSPDPRFDQITFAVYSSPPVGLLFQAGEIKNAQMRCEITRECMEFVQEHQPTNFTTVAKDATFNHEILAIRDKLCDERVFLLPQRALSLDEDEAKVEVEEFLNGVLDKGGEGVVLRDPNAHWKPKRHAGILKYKPYNDAEATVVGFVSGREGKQGNCLGKIGTLVVKYGSVIFEIGTGMTMEEREFETPAMTTWATVNPGTPCPDHFRGKVFNIGTQVTFKYRELSDDGIPKEARFFRPRDEE